jgi:small GTP-binding protein
LQIWDTAGQERFRTITGAYYKGSQAIVVVYDITNESSFKDIEEFWLGEVRHSILQVEKSAIPNVMLFILGNKLDCEEARKVESNAV